MLPGSFSDEATDGHRGAFQPRRCAFPSRLSRRSAPYQPDMTLNVVKMFAGTGAHFAGVIDTVNAIFGPEGINPKHRQTCMMRVAKGLNAPYEWQIHSAIGRNVGLSEDEIAAFASDGPVTGVGSDYILLCRACDELTGAKTLTDETLSELLATFGEVSTRKYILSISIFIFMGLWLNGCRVPLETTDKVDKTTKSNPAGSAVRQRDPGEG